MRPDHGARGEQPAAGRAPRSRRGSGAPRATSSSCWTGRQKHLASSSGRPGRDRAVPPELAPRPRPWPPRPAGPPRRRGPQVGLGVRVALEQRHHRGLVVPAERGAPDHAPARPGRSRPSAAASSRSKCSGVDADQARVRSAACRCSGSSARAAATSASRASRRGDQHRRAPLLGGLQGQGEERLDHAGALLGLPAPAAAQSSTSPVESSPLSSMSQAVPTASARLTGSGRPRPRGQQHLQRATRRCAPRRRSGRRR